ncbi:RNA polymerase sigma factor RpoE [Posidoniimonas polymericola]|uniref:RNA polymerase sigma factor RpoE n=1 Tax=Posidoniimonas polymericola TaxID=2528002 RepID=A0A5C5XXI9_9BACT|nr:DUF2089 family protein [Posidoniimonas polymericola]TWT67670.1 RNA polymerase sigma factor RpoE [Posidoniimonas polymericola]
MPPTNSCPYCQQTMHVCGMHCPACDVEVRAEFPASRLSELPTEHQRFIELFVLSGGSLKQIAEQAGVSYPTVRSRLDKVIRTLRESVEASQRQAQAELPDAAQVLKAI